MNTYEIIRIFGVILLVATSVQCSNVKIAPGCCSHEEIHKSMSPEEMQQVFYTVSADSVPEYDIVKLHMPKQLHRGVLPSGRRMHTIAFGQNINLWLHPTDSTLVGRNTPVYYAKQSFAKPGGVEYRRQDGLMTRVGQIFEDPIELASLVIGTEHSGRTTNGLIGSKRIAIRSLPPRVVDEYSRRRRSIHGPEDPQNSPYHVVIRINETFNENSSYSPLIKTKLPEMPVRSVKAVPDTLYPEVLVVIDHSVYNAFSSPQGLNVNALLVYLVAFWNSVDLRYRSIDSPKFRFHISAIILGEDAGAIPYIENNILGRNALESLSIDQAMADSEKFWYAAKDTFPLDSYDIAATMTRRRLGFHGQFLGKARTQSACQGSHILKKIDAVTIFSDNAAFSGVEPIAHEIGHIFGAWHDIDRGCDDKDGFLMASGPQGTINSSDLSPCSLRDIQERLDNQHLTCLYNRPNEDGESLPRLMAGKMPSRDPPCKFWRGGLSCQYKHPEYSVCEKMFCFNEKGECVDTRGGALDGTQCGTEKDFCLHQRCVRL